MRFGPAATSLVLLSACAYGEPEPCSALESRLSECGIMERSAGLLDACEAGDAEEVAALAEATCEEVFAATAVFVDEAKADDGTGGLCLLSAQCGAGLVCRPDNHFINRCMRPGQLGEHCWSSSQCAGGMSCHWIWHEMAPLSHPGRVCNPHQTAEHLHQAHDDLPGHAHEIPTYLDPTRSYADRVKLQTVLRDLHPYPFHGTGEAWFDHRDGLIVQTLWQDESGRDVFGPHGRLWSWWGNVNWSLTMWQAQVLQRYRGELANLTIVEYADPRFAIPNDVVDAVLALYDTIDQTRRDAEAGRLDPTGRSAAEWKLQQLMWKLHETVLAVSLPRNDDLLEALPPGEREFAASWRSTVELLTAAYFPTNYTTIRRIQRASLPHRPVVPDDFVLTRPSDLSVTARATLIGIRQLDRFEHWTNGGVTWLARRFSSTRERAQRLSQTIEELMVTSGDSFPERIWDWLRSN